MSNARFSLNLVLRLTNPLIVMTDYPYMTAQKVKVLLFYIIATAVFCFSFQQSKAQLKHATISKSLIITDSLIHKGDFYANLAPYHFVDSSIKYLLKAHKLSTAAGNERKIVQTSILLAIQYAKKNEWKTSESFSEMAVAPYLKRDDLVNAAKTYNTLSSMFLFGTNINAKMVSRSVFFSNEERKILLAKKDVYGAALALKHMGDANLYIRNLDSSDNQLKRVLQIYKKVSPQKIHEVYFLLASSSALRGDLPKELEYRMKVFSTMPATTSKWEKAYYFFKAALTYEGMGRYSLALDYLKKSFALYPTQGELTWRFMNDLIKLQRKKEAILFFLNNKKNIDLRTWYDTSFYYRSLGTYYQAIGNNKNAENSYLKLLKFGKGDMSTIGAISETKVNNYLTIINFYLSRRNYTKAAHYITELDSIPKFITNQVTESEIELIKFKTDSGNNRYLSAIKHYGNYQLIKDTILNFSKARQISDMELKYATAEKDKNIALLKKQALMDRERSGYFIACIVLLTIILAALYSRNRLRRRNIKLLREKQTEIISKNTLLEQLNTDNKLLLKEVHHRVKNNMQTIVSLLHSQSAGLQDKTALSAVLDSQHRVYTMALIHQKLYKGELGTTVYMPEYIAEFVDYLKQSFDSGDKIAFSINIEPLFFDVGIAVPIGLIINEAITNSIKHAFNKQSAGEIKVNLFASEDAACLIITDDGCGMPDTFLLEKSTSFGIKLMSGLADYDLGGNLQILTNNGTTLKLSFNMNLFHQ
ncbi:sensor histidine kinase [Mucilaginibacter sp. cycad4]|uniref:tetratricopeptide repeat-containing sensor histidine kinase n=1 Tax=Mucilaginibacter sp. cycad4 TaxID=3342096 RepID=UPI002AAAB4C6|nr:sensor histidine kinase [Mucilaginibacter gossypii]WPU99188.1 sensor histidine kinase [Mucilaginibacter gossypii]